MSNQVKIFHIADFQIELRTSGINQQRFYEFDEVLNIRTIDEIKKQKPDIVYIAGDIYQWENTNGEEQTMFTLLLRNILKLEFVKRIIIINGNHDVKQSNNGIIIGGEKQNQKDSIYSIVRAIDDERISYYEHTGLYKDTVFDITWCVWSQLDKHSAKTNKPNYSPWVENSLPSGASIELYHDPISTCISFDGETPKHFQNYKVSLNDFKCNTVLAGDIHAPQISWFGDGRLFTYSSSLVMRGFGEGDYFKDFKLLHLGNKKHGYNIINFDIDQNKATSCEFIEVKNPIGRYTIELTNQFVYNEENIKMLTSLITPSSINYIRLLCSGNISEFINAQELLLNVFKSTLPNVKLEFAHDENVLNIEIDESAFEDIESVLDKDKILEISKKYINTTVDSTTTIDKEDKEGAKETIYNYLKEQFENIELSQTTRAYNFSSFNFTNFMNFESTSLVITEDRMNVIGGTNGVGKTTAKHGISWLLADQISSSQNMNNTKYNNLQYFNNNSELDTVYGNGTWFDNKGDKYFLEKEITREWKKNKKDIKSKKLIDLISKVKVEYKLTINDNEVLDSDETQKKLKELFNFETLNSIIFVNDGVIDKMMDMSVEDMSQDFLSIMGIDISSMLESLYDDFKDKEMAKLSKPSQTIEEISLQIEVTEGNINELDEKEKNSKENKDRLESNIKDIKDVIETKIKPTLNNVQNLEQFKIKKQTLVNEREQLQLSLQSTTNIIENFENKDISVFDTKLNDINIRLQNKNNEISKNREDVVTEMNINNELKEKGRNRQTELVDDIQKKKDLEQGKIDTLNNKKVELNNKIQVNKDTIVKIKDDRIREIEESISNKQGEYDFVNTAVIQTEKIISERHLDIKASNYHINEHNINIDRLKKSKVCGSCGQELKKEALKKVEDSIEEKQNLILSCESDINRYLSEIEVYEKEKEGHNTLLLKYRDEIAELNTQKQNCQNGSSLTEQQSACMAIISGVVNEIKEVDVKISEVREKITEIENSKVVVIKEDSIVKSIVSDLEVSNNKLNSLNHELNSLNTELVSIQNEQTAVTNERILAIKHNDSLLPLKEELIKKQGEFNNKVSEINNHESILSLVLADEETKKLIMTHENEINVYQEQLNEIVKSEGQMMGTRAIYNERLTTLRKNIEELRRYKLVESSLKLYKRIISKKGLQKYVFAHIIPILNKKANESLNDVDFRLIFDNESLELRFYSLTKDVTQPLQFISGMERTVVGLAITNIKRILNQANRFNFIFIDEISGRLNNGQDLSYEAKDYQRIVMKFLDKLSENVKIYIVDQHLKFFKARKLEVVPSSKGSTIVEIK